MMYNAICFFYYNNYLFSNHDLCLKTFVLDIVLNFSTMGILSQAFTDLVGFVFD